MKRFLILTFCLTSTFALAAANAPTSIAISPQGAVLPTGSSLQFHVTCTYPNHPADDCSFAGGAAWSSPTDSSKLTLSSNGLAKWISDPGQGNVQDGAFGFIVVSAGGLTDRGQILAQHIGDVFYEYPTPDYHNYTDNNGGLIPLNVAVGSTVAMGAGVVLNDNTIGNHEGYPFSMTCNWSSSNPAVATVDRHGMISTLSPGPVTITCGRAGNGVYGTSTASGWISPGNSLSFNVVDGGTGNTTWYVRPDGGTPFVSSALTPAGQCDGKHDAAYPGSGVNQPCALGDFEDLYFDQVNHLRQVWMIAGGDTVIVRQKPGGYNVAMNQVGYSPTNCTESIYCDLPNPPSGTAARHTRILGENYGSCHSDSAKSLLTLNGREAFNVKDSQFVDIACFAITDKAACAADGEYTNGCKIGTDYFGRIGIVQSALTSNVTYTDLLIDGMSSEGIHGASGSDTVVANYVHIRGPAMAGIDMDDTPWASGNISVAGGFTMNNSITEFSGCVEEYPVVHNYPYIECRDQNTAPSAPLDGLGTGSTTGNWSFDHDIWRYNFQDGLDLLHSGMQSLSVTNSQSYGNDGQAYKIGAAGTVIFRNNFALVNCARIGQTIGDEPASAVVPGVNLCRAAGDWIPMQFSGLGTYIVQNNTLAGYGATVFDFGCSNGWDNCSGAKSVFQNNVVLGYVNNAYNQGQNPGVFYQSSQPFNMPANNGWAVRDHNVFYNLRSCPSLGVGETCNTANPDFLKEPASPLTNEASLDSFSYIPASGSPLLGAGTSIPGLVTDIVGNSRQSPPSIGVMDASGSSSSSPSKTSISLNVTPSSTVAGTNVTFTSGATASGSTFPSGNITFLANGSVVGSGPLSASGLASFSTSSLAVGTYTISASYPGDANFAASSSSSASLDVANPTGGNGGNGNGGNGSSPAQPTVTLSASPNPAVVGQAVTLSASVAGSSATPTGTVSFTLLGKPLAAKLNGGRASISITSLAAGTYSASATYAGDASFSSASSTPVSFTVGAASAPVSISIAQPQAGFNVIPSSLRRIFATVTGGGTDQVTWAVKSGGAQISSSSGSWIDVTAPAKGSSCQVSKNGGIISSSTQFTIEATSVDDRTKSAEVTFNVCSPTVQISTVPAYRTLYSGQSADIQSLVVGSVNDTVQWTIASQPNGGDGKLVDANARDTVFSATEPGRYTLVATSAADHGQVASTILYVTGHSMPYRVTRNGTEPVDCSVDPALLGTTYDVGPSQPYQHLRDVPFNTVIAGSTIRLHNEDTTSQNPTVYHEYLQLAQHARSDQPVRVCGVPDAAGNLPILDGANAAGRSDTSALAVGNGLITVGENTSGAAWPSFNGAQDIIVEGIHLRNARAGVAYTTPSGASANWQSSAACIRIGDGHNISLIGDEMDGCSNGAASLWNGTTWGGSSLNHLWEGNHIHGSGTSGSSANHQMYLQAWGQVVQFNRIDQIASGAAGANLKSRGIQDIIRYNYFGDGPARDLDLVDVVDAAQFMSFSDFLQNNAKPSSSTYSMDLLAAWQEAWNSHFAYGNIYLNSTATAPIHFSYDESAGETARKGNLFWYNNTFYQEACLACTNQLWTMFDTSAGDGTYLPQTEFQAVQALNNVLWMDSTTQPAFQWNNFDALIGLGTSNLLPANWGTNTMLGGVGDGWNVTANPFAYQNAGTLSLHISGFGTSDVQTSSAIPFDKTSWILANAAVGDTSLPAPVCAMPTRFSYLPSLGYAVARTSPPNLGATDTAPQASATLSLVGGARRPAAASTICH